MGSARFVLLTEDWQEENEEPHTRKEGDMDLRQFYRKLREIESSIPDKYPFVTSLATDDGGKEGVMAEVPRYQAARMIVEGRVRLATDEEKKEYLDNLAAAQKAAADWEAARRAPLGFLLGAEQRQSLPKPKPSK
jgi:hypothetical protein